MSDLVTGLQEAMSDPNALDRCKRRWEVVRMDFRENKYTHNVEAMERHEMWLSMVKQGRTSETTDGVMYYKTIRKPHIKNTVYILWRGEASVFISRAFTELAFKYDHLPNVKFVLLTGTLTDTHVPVEHLDPRVEVTP